MTIKPFIMMEYELLGAHGFVDQTTGEFIKLIANDKILYSYIKARIKFFVDEKRGEYFDTQEAIAEALCMDVKSARNSLQKFTKAGALVCEKKMFRNFKNWRYSKLNELVLWKKGEDGNPEIIRSEEPRQEHKPKPKPPVQQNNWYEDENDGLPF